MGIVGIAKRGFGRALKTYKKKKATAKMKSGTSTRAERLEFGKRDKDIKSVPMSETAKKGDVSKSVEKAKDVWPAFGDLNLLFIIFYLKLL